jgi:TetR/AcrR family transcriptional regulator, mexJK operon transcriptional repressor
MTPTGIINRRDKEEPDGAATRNSGGAAVRNSSGAATRKSGDAATRNTAEAATLNSDGAATLNSGGAAARNAGRPTRHEAAALPARILDAAQELFLAQGFEATTLDQIAARAGATKRTLYVKIGDKAELFAHVVRRMLDLRREKLNDTAATGSSAERLIRFGESLLAIALDRNVLRLYRVLVAEAPRFPALARLMEEQLTRGSRARLADLLRDETTRNLLALDDPELAAELLLTMIVWAPQRAVLFGAEPWGPARCARWVRAAVRLFLHGCQTRTGAGREC